MASWETSIELGSVLGRHETGRLENPQRSCYLHPALGGTSDYAMAFALSLFGIAPSFHQFRGGGVHSDSLAAVLCWVEVLSIIDTVLKFLYFHQC